MNKTTSKVLDKMIDNATAERDALRAENAKLRSVLEQIVGNSALVLNSQPGAEGQCLREILIVARAALAQ